MKNPSEWLELQAKRQKMSKSELARAMGISYRVYYNKVKSGKLGYLEVLRGVDALGFSLLPVSKDSLE
jgi:hypothetical protein